MVECDGCNNQFSPLDIVFLLHTSTGKKRYCKTCAADQPIYRGYLEKEPVEIDHEWEEL